MSDEPVNKLYGNKIKLDFTKLGNKSKADSSTTVDVKKESIKQKPKVEPKVEKPVEEKPEVEPKVENPVEEKPEVEPKLLMRLKRNL